MVCREPNEMWGRIDAAATWRIDVTDLTPKERRKLFAECMKQRGFTAFIQQIKNNRTHYIFKYQN